MAYKLEVSNITCALKTKHVFSDVSFGVEEGTAFAVAGKSGSGKTMLLEICGGLRAPVSGSVAWNNATFDSMSQKELFTVRRKMGFVFQQHALIHNYPIFDNIALPLRYHFQLPEKEVREKVFELLGMFELTDAAYLLPEFLSVAQTRCAALARALVLDPEILFLDEPTSGLDPVSARLVVTRLKAIRQRKPMTFFIISHNIYILRELSCRVKILHEGKLVDLAACKDMADGPVPEIATFLSGV